jgi:type I restriction enzyme S subunit
LAQLGELASIVRGISFPKADKRSEPLPGHVACLRTTNVQRSVEWDDLWFVPEGHVKREEQFVRTGDILISTANSYELVGKVAPVHGLPHKATLGAFISLIRPNDSVDPKFLYHQLAWGKTQQRIRETASTTTNISNVSTKKLLALELFVPELDEQRRIVAEIDKQFSRLDEAVANLQRVKANLKRYKAAVLKAAVEGRLVETEASIARREGRTYEAGEQLLQRVAEVRKSLAKGKRVSSSAADDVGQLVCPEGWAWSTCDAAIQAIDAGASFKCEERPPVGDEVGVLKVSALTWGAYDESESKTCKDTARIEEKFLVRDGDFLFSRANTIELVGACVIVGKTTKRLMLSDKTLRFTVSKGVLPEWLQICLRCKFGRDEIERLATGNQESMRNIGQERIRQIRMPFPPHAEQARIVAEVDRHLSIIREVETELNVSLQRAQALRQSVLDKGFSGEHLVQSNFSEMGENL